MNRLILPFALLVCLAPLRAEMASGALSGGVTDASGSVVPGTQILLRGIVNREVSTDDAGRFRLATVPVGSYEVIAEKSGFAVLQRTVTVTTEELQLSFILQPATMLQVIEVNGAPDLVGESVMKMAGSLHETPRAASVFNAEQLRERNVRSVPELLAFVPGMSPNSYRNGSYHFYARGFRMLPTDTRVDGFTGINLGGGGFGASMFGIEQAIVLRGPAGLQYGATGSPGGFINLVTKKPQPIRSTRLDLRGSSFAGSGVPLTGRPSVSFDFDSTGAVTRGGRILYRTLFTSEHKLLHSQPA